jgi:hypothetical protein
MKPITEMSEQARDYTVALTTADTLPALMRVLESYRTIADDALRAAPKDEMEFTLFRHGLLEERSGKFAGVDWSGRYGSVTMPRVLLQVATVAAHKGSPWGWAFLRIQEAGKIKIGEGGIVTVMR